MPRRPPWLRAHRDSADRDSADRDSADRDSAHRDSAHRNLQGAGRRDVEGA
jgi:hypothetical protein